MPPQCLFPLAAMRGFSDAPSLPTVHREPAIEPGVWLPLGALASLLPGNLTCSCLSLRHGF